VVLLREEAVVIEAEHLQVILQRLQVVDGFRKVRYLVLAQGEDVETVEVIKALNFSNLVLVEGQVLKLGKSVQALNLLNQVKAEIKPGKVDKSVKASDLGDDIIVQL